ncbi:DUF5994 family protein [Streptomyces sp. NPDC058683]|uniref:DUF5994 family protein n=1 Tax=Streptomyces sp. NPDC058683 TaxID=3346597 RepID=UPI0036595075
MRTRDLRSRLPGLLTALTTRLGPIARVGLDASDFGRHRHHPGRPDRRTAGFSRLSRADTPEPQQQPETPAAPQTTGRGTSRAVCFPDRSGPGPSST